MEYISFIITKEGCVMCKEFDESGAKEKIGSIFLDNDINTIIFNMPKEIPPEWLIIHIDGLNLPIIVLVDKNEYLRTSKVQKSYVDRKYVHIFRGYFMDFDSIRQWIYDISPDNSEILIENSVYSDPIPVFSNGIFYVHIVKDTIKM